MTATSFGATKTLMWTTGERTTRSSLKPTSWTDVYKRQAKDSDITEVWVWYEQTSGNSYEVYIGYA